MSLCVYVCHNYKLNKYSILNVGNGFYMQILDKNDKIAIIQKRLTFSFRFLWLSVQETIPEYTLEKNPRFETL